jgi:Tol biopolymer transport system component
MKPPRLVEGDVPNMGTGSRWRTSALLLLAAFAFGCGAETAPLNPGTIQQPETEWSADSPAWSPDGSRIAYSRYLRGSPSTTGIWIVDTAGVVGPQVLRGEWHDTDWSLDGTRLAISYAGNKGIYSVKATGDGLQAITTSGSRPRWSPTGNELAFQRLDTAGTGSIWIVSQDGTGLRSLAPTGIESWRDPDWSPDGTRLVHVRQPSPDSGGAIFVMDATGHAEQRLTTAMGYIDPTWSPDGRWIACTLSPDHIFLMRPDGTEAHYLTDGDIPSWSPDSRRIAFSRYNWFGFGSLYAIDIATLQIRQITQ